MQLGYIMTLKAGSEAQTKLFACHHHDLNKTSIGNMMTHLARTLWLPQSCRFAGRSPRSAGICSLMAVSLRFPTSSMNLGRRHVRLHPSLDGIERVLRTDQLIAPYNVANELPVTHGDTC